MDETLPIAVVDEEINPAKVLARFATLGEAVHYINGITDRDKVQRGGFGIDVKSQ